MNAAVDVVVAPRSKDLENSVHPRGVGPEVGEPVGGTNRSSPALHSNRCTQWRGVSSIGCPSRPLKKRAIRIGLGVPGWSSATGHRCMETGRYVGCVGLKELGRSQRKAGRKPVFSQ